jgi:hypothetical protein
VRHVRMLGLCLAALFAVSALMAGTALAETKTEKVLNEAYAKFKNCPWQLGRPTVELCFTGVTKGGSNGGFFELGRVSVPLSKPVTLQGGLHENEAEEKLFIVPATTETLESPELTVPKGLSLITPEVEKQAEWSPSTIAAFKEAKTNKETSLKVKIEVAGGNKLYEIPNALNTTNLIFEQGAAFTLPLKVRMISPWLTKLGGGPCTVGNETTPVFQELTTEPAKGGSAGDLEILNEGNLVILRNSKLTDLGWEVPAGAEASGCGGAMEAEVDKAINIVLGLDRREHGITVLSGTLYESTAESVEARGG